MSKKKLKKKKTKTRKKITQKKLRWKKKLRGKVLFPIQSFSPSRFLYMGRCSRSILSPTFYFVSYWGRRSFFFLPSYYATPGALRFFFCSYTELLVRLSSWMKDRTDEGKICLERIRFATYRLTWVAGFSLIFHLFFFFLLDYDRFWNLCLLPYLDAS